MIAEIIGPSGRVHYRRPVDDPMIDEARATPGYRVRVDYGVQFGPHRCWAGIRENVLVTFEHTVWP